jgi:hypothetical protein
MLPLNLNEWESINNSDLTGLGDLLGLFPTSSHHRKPDLRRERAVRQKTSCLSRR